MGSLGVGHFAILAVIVLMFAPACMWCISYKKLLDRFDKKNQKFSPNLAFLLLIPIIGLLWWGYLALYVKNNLSKINEIKPFDSYEDGGFIFAIMSIASSILAVVIPSFYIIFVITAFVLWVFSWIKIVKTRKIIQINI